MISSSNRPRQSPAPDTHLLRFCGERIEFSLRLDSPLRGTAYLRTNLGNAGVRRREIIDAVEKERPRLDTDWHDHPMERISESEFRLRTTLDEAGIFAAKCFFQPEGEEELLWPTGGNIAIKVEPAALAAANTIYTGFVRQFGANKSAAAHSAADEQTAVEMEKRGYTVIPPSGRFRDMIDDLDLIITRMGFRFIQLLPIHPIPTTYARMGRFGSPFAALDFFNVDRSLAEFDSRTTPLEQFLELVQEIHRRDGRVILDIALNHTGWASQLQIHHPEWFPRNSDGSFRSPGAWGVVWEDLSELDYRHKSLWRYVAEVFLYWCAQGVDGFRCDAGYMIPFEVWEYVVAKVRDIYPETVFLLEGLGGKISVTRDLIGRAGLNWAYSEIFQNYNRDELERYLPQAFAIEEGEGLLVDFAETHDNNRLAARSHAYARLRTALCALASKAGAFAITNGVEWFAQEKIDVHSAPGLNWGAEDNLVEWLARLNALISTHSAFQHDSARRLIETDDGNSLAILRTAADGTELLVLANLSDTGAEPVNWTPPRSHDGAVLHDLLADNARVEPAIDDDRARLLLAPGQVLCLSPSPWEPEQSTPCFAATVDTWRRRAKYLELLRAASGDGAPLRPVADAELDEFIRDPRAALRQICGSTAPVHVDLTLPRDLKRVVMVPPGHFLIVGGATAFRVRELGDGVALYSDSSLPAPGSGHEVIIPPAPGLRQAERRVLEIKLQKPATGGPSCAEALILRLPPYPLAPVSRSWRREELADPDLCALAVNCRATAAYVRADWSQIRSQYDAILSVNPGRGFPADRRVLWTRCRCWLVCNDYSREIDLDGLTEFAAGAGSPPRWRFALPIGRGMTVPLCIELNLDPAGDSVCLAFTREKRLSGDQYPLLPASESVRLIIRPDVEDRNFHAKTKAFMGAEGRYGSALEIRPNGFSFKPSDIELRIESYPPACRFVGEPEWTYMVGHPIDAERGLDGSSDLFSPGYFELELQAGDSLVLNGSASLPYSEQQAGIEAVQVNTDAASARTEQIGLLEAARRACSDFIARRNQGHTIIAGYPWFLDWGRDTLIALRGIIADGRHGLALEILREFARFEQSGTLPNMIHGDDASNRDTSDAQLWFIISCRDLCAAAPELNILDSDCGGRRLRAVIVSIAENYCDGTPNGIRVDPDSGLVYSPEHYTWMDTQHPAGTPRSGYPIEIQALWCAALAFIKDMPESDHARWSSLADKVRDSICTLFPRPEGWLADCLHADAPGTPARDCVADDHCRPNQLFAVTLGDILPLDKRAAVIQSCAALLVPGAIRSLADDPTQYHLPVRNYNGELLNDPGKPYWGHYTGDEDSRRKPAYHNGTAWGWQFPSYCEALVKVYGDEAVDTALALLGSAAELFNHGCAGHLPEILDGDAPHSQRGCSAQAWSASEVLRVGLMLAGVS
jgi:starch synthase (maltosyl-transferring)